MLAASATAADVGLLGAPFSSLPPHAAAAASSSSRLAIPLALPYPSSAGVGVGVGSLAVPPPSNLPLPSPSSASSSSAPPSWDLDFVNSEQSAQLHFDDLGLTHHWTAIPFTCAFQLSFCPFLRLRVLLLSPSSVPFLTFSLSLLVAVSLGVL